MAWISSSENPLAILPITVEGRSPLRKACIAAMISAGWSPTIRGIEVFTSLLSGWQPEQEDAPGGGPAVTAELVAISTNAQSKSVRPRCAAGRDGASLTPA
jgi:hypothetical protein